MPHEPKTKQSSFYPPPLVIPPLSDKHTTTFILLHGRGSNAQAFGPLLLATRLATGFTFQESLAQTKFVFPTASFRRATFAKRIPITQWFDSHSLDYTKPEPEYEIEGLRESTRFLRSLIEEEAKLVSTRNIIVGGLSQGAALSLIAALAWDGEKLGAVIGMAAWLRCQDVMLAAIDGGDRSNRDGGGLEDDIFEAEDRDQEAGQADDCLPGSRAVRALRDELDLDVDGPTPVFDMPIFLGHGVQDEKIPIELGRQSFNCLKKLGCNVLWHEYQDLGHWYYEQQLADILHFLHEKVEAIAGSPKTKSAATSKSI